MLFHLVYTLVWPIFHTILPFKIIGKEKLAHHRGGYAICANHISFVDPAYIVYALTRKNRVFFMSKQELFKNKLTGWLIHGIGGFPVNRSAGASTGLKTAEEILKSGHTLGIFPEGTRSRNGELGKAKAGAAMVVSGLNTYVLPITLICKKQQVRPFRKVTVVIGDPVTMPQQNEDMPKREYLRLCTKAIMSPIEEALEQYGSK